MAAKDDRRRAGAVDSGPGYKCARCGGDVGHAPLTEAVAVSYATADGVAETLFLCLKKDKTHERCATRVLTKAATAHAAPDGLDLWDPSAGGDQGT